MSHVNKAQIEFILILQPSSTEMKSLADFPPLFPNPDKPERFPLSSRI